MNSENKNVENVEFESLSNEPIVTRNVDIKEIKEIEGNKEDMNKKRKKTKNTDKLGFNWVMLVCLVIIAIPCCIFLWILLSAMKDTGTPILGNRFMNDLDPAISEVQITTIENKISELDGVESCNANLIVATLRVHVDAEDALTQDEISALTTQVYETVSGVLPVETYFTLTDEKKQYDLEINVYNNLSFEDDFIMYNIVKNSAMEEYRLQDVSTPIDAELAQELRDYVIERDQPKEDKPDKNVEE